MIYSKETQIGKRTKPKRGQRNTIKAKDYEKAILIWGETCFCGNPYVEMHHIVFRSRGGRGVWRNLHPLCKQHHEQAHTIDEFRRHLEIQHKRKFGDYFWMGAHDLFANGLIEEPTNELVERYFEKVAREKSL